MSEFTGERVIPGQVSEDLWAEHISRYAFAERFAPGRRILDLGCGTGYGAAELARSTTSFVTGLDLAPEALSYAATHFPESQYVRGAATQLPFVNAAFDLITAFEVIEHLSNWRELLAEVKRVLAPSGVFLVSTPNRLYYAESRAETGPNPFHHHEFEFAEIREALTEFFPQVTLYLQNRLEAVAFYAADRYTTAEATIEQSSGAAADANFFIGICSDAPVEAPALLYVPKATNLLREREHHIRLLKGELAQNQTWVQDITQDRDRLLQLHGSLEKDFDHRGRWAAELQGALKTAQARITQLQAETEQLTQGYERHIRVLEEENVNKTQWALDTEHRLTEEVEQQNAELGRAVELLKKAESTIVERTQWAQRTESQLRDKLQQLNLLRQSRWIRLGRKVGLGPRLGNPEKPPKSE